MQVIYRYSIIGSVFGLQIRKASVRFGLPMQILINNNMEYNKNGAIDRYYNLDNILKLNLDNNVIENIEKKFGKENITLNYYWKQCKPIHPKIEVKYTINKNIYGLVNNTRFLP